MKTKSLYKFLILLVFLIKPTEFLYGQEDSIDYIIDFECYIYLDSTQLDLKEIDLSVNVNSNIFNLPPPSDRTETSTYISIPGLFATNNTIDKETLDFKLWANGCYSEIISYTFDSSRSTANRCYITSFRAESYSVRYPSQICNYAEPILPVSNLPVKDISFASTKGISINSDGRITPKNSTPGNYIISLTSNYCLESKSLPVTILENTKINLQDTIHICPEKSFDLPQGELVNYYFRADDRQDSLTYFDITQSGYYVAQPISGECYISDTTFVELRSKPVFDFIQDIDCDRVRLNFNNQDNYSIKWADSSSANQIEILDSKTVSATITDKYGCKSFRSIDVEVRKLELDSPVYEKEESECWKEGRINIITSSVRNNIGEYNYQLVNILNNKEVERLDQVPEGEYYMVVKDSRNCIAIDSNKITVLQKCLEDYPVFTPNKDGLEDEYFIPYEGKIKIYNRDGRLISELNTPAYWDGTDSNGNLMPMGNYVMVTDNGKSVNITIVR